MSYDLVLCCSGFKEILLQFMGIGIKFSGSMNILCVHIDISLWILIMYDISLVGYMIVMVHYAPYGA